MVTSFSAVSPFVPHFFTDYFYVLDKVYQASINFLSTRCKRFVYLRVTWQKKVVM
jgi:hypothetical protein